MSKNAPPIEFRPNQSRRLALILWPFVLSVAAAIYLNGPDLEAYRISFVILASIFLGLLAYCLVTTSSDGSE